MSENNKVAFSPHLSAKELLSTKGICTQIIDEYKEVIKVLPKTGVKLFEPNGSWLQHKQIDTCLTTRKDLLKVERANRLSALAVAEWLPNEKRAKVIKRSGVEWNNYGKDIRGSLYLIPEEALLLLEMNRMELLYNTLSLSVQQAYALLLNSPNADCTLNEYRVFSQLARLGYRLQRFQYEKSTTERLEEAMQPKKKVIVDPDNGRWMGKTCNVASTLISCISGENEPREIQKEVKEIVNNSEPLDVLEGEEDKQEVSKDLNDKNYKLKPRVEIVSEETIVDPVKLIIRVDHDSSCAVENKTTRWSGARIQRNVKLLPKRNNKISSLPPSLETSKNITTSQIPTCSNIIPTMEKRKTEMTSPQLHKKSKQEIIELSDDEIEEIPRTMTRMEMLNCIPNIAVKDCIVQKISRAYIPHSIKPQNTVYQYNRAHILRIRENNRNAHVPSNSSTSKQNYSNSDLSIINSIVPYQSPMNSLISQSDINHFSLCSPLSFRNFHYNPRFCQTSNRHYRGLNLNSFIPNSSILSNYNFYMSHFRSTLQLNAFRNFAMVGFALRSASMQNRMNVNQMMCTTGSYQYRQRRRQNFHGNPLPPYHSHNFSSNMKMIMNNEQRKDSMHMINDDAQYQASFVKMPADSWNELKRKWNESKTITIEDEDEDDKMDCSEGEVTLRNTQSLINARNVKNFSDVYNKIRIIKSAEVKTVRRKKGDYKISYKVYASTQHYRKSDPGTPMFYIALTGRTKKFLQPVDLNRLQQDGSCTSIVFACISDASITFMQAGLVTLPNLAN